mmetsp:Transcript_3733/g.8675  ORF Transcript_3733/g.8675 Transcript_3733/m.8675 type:complete len:202 (-) Transcript_3733:753-1358(-)
MRDSSKATRAVEAASQIASEDTQNLVCSSPGLPMPGPMQHPSEEPVLQRCRATIERAPKACDGRWHFGLPGRAHQQPHQMPGHISVSTMPSSPRVMYLQTEAPWRCQVPQLPLLEHQRGESCGEEVPPHPRSASRVQVQGLPAIEPARRNCSLVEILRLWVGYRHRHHPRPEQGHPEASHPAHDAHQRQDGLPRGRKHKPF